MTQTQVAIVGAGPAGLLLAHLLDMQNIDSIVIEKHSRAHIENRVRAGVLEQGTVDTLVDSGVGERLKREGLVHHGLELSFEGRRHRLDLHELTDGRAITVYGQQEVIKDLIKARLDKGGQILFEAGDVSIDDPVSNKPSIRFRHNDELISITCDFVAGCDGFHGITRSWIGREVPTIYEQTWPFSWLGILAKSFIEHVHADRPGRWGCLSLQPGCDAYAGPVSHGNQARGNDRGLLRSCRGDNRLGAAGPGAGTASPRTNWRRHPRLVEPRPKKRPAHSGQWAGRGSPP